jgi:NAD-dependent DNA ligase
LNGVTIEYATGFNGSFIESNKIGIGAVIQIIRSGDVIPHIKAVTVAAENAKMPTVAYHWTETHIDIILDDLDQDDTVREKNITAFFTSLEVDGLSGGNVRRIMKAGFKSVAAILKMGKSDFEKVEGFKQKMIDKISEGIKTKVAGASLLNIMVASNVLGRGLGERKMKPILETYPDILTSRLTNEEKVKNLRDVPGIGPENAKTFVSNIPVFIKFLKDCGLESKLSGGTIENKLVVVNSSHPLFQKHIVMTKVRDAAIIENLKKVGGILDETIGKNTFVLIVKSKEDVSNKTKYADEHEIPIMTPAEFLTRYFS